MEKPIRPYVTLVAELGVTVTLGKSHLEIGKGGTRTSSCITGTTPPKHPRYSLRAYGCTDATWKVIGDTEREEYMQVLGTDNLLEDHPTEDEDSLQLVRQMLPFWDEDATWFSDEPEPAKIAQSSAAADGY
ncbi:hypothetical protein J3R82DRAFT_10319 [Butyriboletus roseoflavus]|nr:hypothetical protein J3R82DRAFT_10319 [Butyriboletus roseoflavus]